MNSKALFQSFVLSPDLRRRHAAVYLHQRIQRTCEHAWLPPFHSPYGSSIACGHCSLEQPFTED